MYKEYLIRSGIPNQTIEKTARILSYEVGDIHRALIYLEQFTEEDQVKKDGLTAELKTAIADTLTMAGLICEQAGMDWNKAIDLGKQRFLDRLRDVQEGKKTR